jgi:hypothetical protein
MGLLFAAALALAAACMLFRISPWIWAAPLFAAFISGFILLVRHGDRVAVAASASSATKDGSHKGVS